MGYTDGAGPQGSPLFNTNPQTAADLNRLRDLILERGNRLKGTTTDRNNLTGAILTDGLEFWDTTEDVVYVYDAGWKPIGIGPWVAYTPTLSSSAGSFSVGAGTVTAKWRRERDLIRTKVKFVLGTGFAVGGIPQFTLPVNAIADSGTDNLAGAATFWDSSPAVGYAAIVAMVASSITTARLVLSGTNGVYAPVGPNTPFTWAAGDVLRAEFTYEPA